LKIGSGIRLSLSFVLFFVTTFPTSVLAQTAINRDAYGSTNVEESLGIIPEKPVKKEPGYEFTVSGQKFKIAPTLSVDVGMFVNGNAWFGNAAANIGDKSNNWYEGDVKPGFEMETSFANGLHLTSALNAVYAGQFGDIDAAGSTFPDQDQDAIEFEDAYLRIDSGKTLPQLGEGAVYFSFGRQQYKIGNGMLVKSGSSNGGDRGAYWLGPRKAFDMTAIAGLDMEKIKGQLFYLEPDDNPDSDTQTVGVNMDWEIMKEFKLGLTYMNFPDADEAARDGLNVYDMRVWSTPFASLGLPDLHVGGEYAWEDNDDALDAGGGWVGAIYTFNNVTWKPSIGGRFAWFDGDDPNTAANEAFDPLYYGSTDWGSWYQGEILGEYALTNSNLESYAMRLRANPTEDLTLTLTAFRFMIPEEATFGSGITDDHYGDEVNFLVDWVIRENLSMYMMAGVAFPGDGAEQATGGDENWTQAIVGLSWNY
jgi:hypothetical protein